MVIGKVQFDWGKWQHVSITGIIAVLFSRVHCLKSVSRKKCARSISFARFEWHAQYKCELYTEMKHCFWNLQFLHCILSNKYSEKGFDFVKCFCKVNPVETFFQQASVRELARTAYFGSLSVIPEDFIKENGGQFSCEFKQI